MGGIAEPFSSGSLKPFSLTKKNPLTKSTGMWWLVSPFKRGCCCCQYSASGVFNRKNLNSDSFQLCAQKVETAIEAGRKKVPINFSTSRNAEAKMSTTGGRRSPGFSIQRKEGFQMRCMIACSDDKKKNRRFNSFVSLSFRHIYLAKYRWCQWLVLVVVVVVVQCTVVQWHWASIIVVVMGSLHVCLWVGGRERERVFLSGQY